MFQIVHFQKILEGQCLNKNRLTTPLYILLDWQAYMCKTCHNVACKERTRTTNVVRNAGCARSRYTQKIFFNQLMN